MTDDNLAPGNVPDVINQPAAELATLGALFRAILRQPPRSWQVLCSRVLLGAWRARAELVEDDQGADLVFVLEVRKFVEMRYGGAGERFDWHGLVPDLGHSLVLIRTNTALVR